MNPRRVLIGCAGLGVLALVGALLIADDDTDWATFVLSAAVLVLALVGLAMTSLPARLSIQRQDELGLDDLIFYVTDPVHELRGAPAEYLLQLHVAVANIGARKAVLSKLELVELLYENGTRCVLPETPMPLRAHRYEMRHVWDHIGHTGPHSASEQVHPPFVLSPDDVMTLRFRLRRGVRWSEKHTTIEDLRHLHSVLARSSIARARLRATFRQGDAVRTSETVVPLSVVQQKRYADALRDLTSNFTEWPTQIHTQAVDYEG